MNDVPAPTSTPGATPDATPTATSRASKLPIILIVGGMIAVLAIVLWIVRDNQAAADLTTGTCFDVPARSSGISTVTRHACTETHDAEVFHVAEYRDTTYPISLSLDRFIDVECVPAFTTYVGEAYTDSADLSIGYFYPERDAWDAGDRTFTCYVTRTDDAKLTESLKGSGS